MRRRLTAVPIALIGLLLAASPAAAGDFEVTTTADGTGACPPVRTLQCTLRAAINQVNATQGEANTIHLPAGTYTLESSLPAINRRVAITGDGAALTTVDGAYTGRVFTVAAENIVQLAGLTVARGTAELDTATPYGGNILVQSSGLVTLVDARVTAGRAADGGGIALLNGRAAIGYSLIDANTGGGILAQADGSTTLLLIDSTVAFNTGSAVGGIAVTRGAKSTTTLERVTVAYNTATAVDGGGLRLGEDQPGFTVKSSIVAGNLGSIEKGPVQPSNCGQFGRPVDGGQNVESLADCGFTTGSQNADPRLADALGATGELALLAGSPAIDRAVDCGTGTRDQDGTARPVGAACDAGASEYVPPPAQPQPSPTPAPTVAPTPAPTVAPTPTPEYRRTAVAGRVSGTVRVRLPGRKTFTSLPAVQAVRFGSTIDARRGVVVLTSVPRAGGKPQSARFSRGMFRVTQSGSLTTLTLNEPLARCPRSHARAAAAKKKPKKRRLFGDGKGRFRTRGQYSAATVRGTKWLVEDGCRYTRTKVTEGSVKVRDSVRRKTVVVRKGKTYTARKKR